MRYIVAGLIGAAMLLFAPGFTHAGQLIIIGDDDQPPQSHKLRPEHLRPEFYNTLDEAATAALQRSADKSPIYEYGGIILRTSDGRFRFTEPQTNFRGDAVRLPAIGEVDYAGYYTVADFHTHPCLPYTHFEGVFSDADIDDNKRHNTIGYMAELCSGRVLRFVPGATPEDFVFFDEHPDMIGSRGEEIARLKLRFPHVAFDNPTPEGILRGNTP